MPHTYCQNTLHIVFSTKGRRASIPEDFQAPLWAYIAGVCRNFGVLPLAIGGTENHIHLLAQIPAILPVAKAVSVIKANSSRWASQRGKKFSWQQGYGAFSVGASVVPAVVRYIQNQKIHHRKLVFETEFTDFLKSTESNLIQNSSSIDARVGMVRQWHVLRLRRWNLFANTTRTPHRLGHHRRHGKSHPPKPPLLPSSTYAPVWPSPYLLRAPASKLVPRLTQLGVECIRRPLGAAPISALC
jgi:putative transposase